MLRCIAITVVVVLVMTGPALATVDIWVSASATTSGPFPPGPTNVPEFHPYVGGSGSIFIWGRPDGAKSLVNLSLNLVTDTPNVIAFTSATVYNPQFSMPLVTRFEYVDDSTTGLPIMANEIKGITGLRIYENGIPPAIGIGSSSDPNRDGLNTSWLIARIDYDALSTGENSQTQLYLEIGRIGLNHAGETTAQCDVLFGDAMDGALNGRFDREKPSNNYDARIQPRILSGDADRNGAVEPADYDIWRASFDSITQLAADHSGNGIVDTADYAIWRKNLGLSAGFGGAIAIPEPSAAVSASFALMVFWAARRRSFSREN